MKNLRESIGYKIEILRLSPQNDITTQSLEGEGRGENDERMELQKAHRFYERVGFL